MNTYCRLTTELTISPRGTPVNIRIYLIFSDTRIIGLHFEADSVIYLHSHFSGGLRKRFLISARVTFRPFKVKWRGQVIILLPFESAFATSYWIRHSNHGPILHRFRNTAGFVLMTPLLFHPILGVFPLDQTADLGTNLSRYLKLFVREIIFEVFQPVWKTCLNVTDRETDRLTDWPTHRHGKTALCRALKGTNDW